MKPNLSDSVVYIENENKIQIVTTHYFAFFCYWKSVNFSSLCSPISLLFPSLSSLSLSLAPSLRARVFVCHVYALLHCFLTQNSEFDC